MKTNLFKTVLLISVLALFLGACTSENDPIKPPIYGSLSISWNTKLADSDPEKGNPDQVTVVLQPGDITRTFNFSKGSGSITGLEPEIYSAEVTVFDSAQNLTHKGSRSNITIEPGETTSSSVELTNMQPGSLSITWNTKLETSDPEKGNPEQAIVVLQPGNITKTFSFSNGSGIINDLEPALYSAEVSVYDSAQNLTHQGSRSNITIEAGETTSASVQLTNLQPGKLSISWNTKLADSQPDKGNPYRVKVNLQPGNSTHEFFFGSGRGNITGLDAAVYSASLSVYDSSQNMTHRGSKSNINVEAGNTTSVSVQLTSLKPSTPRNVSASTNNTTSIRVSWNPVQDADKYVISRSTSSSGYYSTVKETSSSSWTDYGVDMARKYYYKVKAKNEAGSSNYSPPARGYRRGFRLSEESIYDTSTGVGLEVDLHGYGYRDQKRLVVIYAVYKNGSSYYYIPGSGFLGKAAKAYNADPSYDMSWWNDWRMHLQGSLWRSDFQNDNYPQYIKARVYKSSSVNNLNASYYDETPYFGISWSKDKSGQTVPQLNGKAFEDAITEIIDLYPNDQGSTTSTLPMAAPENDLD
jgi:hypothetical protein